jgi:hypothetical protein
MPNGIQDILKQAQIQGWSDAETQSAIYQSKFFQDAYPGYFSPDGSQRFSNVAQYHQMNTTFRQVAQQYGYKWDRSKFATAMDQQVSPTEFQARLDVVHKIDTVMKEQPHVFDQFNQELQAMGMSKLGQEGFYKFSIGDLEQKFSDIYEAAHLKAQGLDVGTGQAMKLAKLSEGGGFNPGSPDSPGQGNSGPIDVQSILALRPDIHPELKAAGLSEFQIAKAKAGYDPGGTVANTIAQLQAQRRQLGAPGGSERLSRTGVGSVGIQSPEQMSSQG